MTRSGLLKQYLHEHYPTVSHGEGVYLYDTEGRQYLDGCGGAMTASVGHGLAEVSRAMEAQARKVAFTYRTQFTNQPAEDLASRLACLAPGDLDTTFFVNSGSEATEFAIRAAVKYWTTAGRPGKVKILSRQTSYHGMTMGALSMSGHAARRPDYGSLLHPFPVAPPAHAFRYARADESEEEYAERAADEVERAIIAQDPDTVAAFILEPIVGAAGGVLVPPSGYLAAVAAACRRLDVLFIADEVITGVGRTGDWFACSGEQVVPDLLVLGKSLSGGYFPVAAVMMSEHVVDILQSGDGVAPFGHTFSGNPLGAATCMAILDILEREDALKNARTRGEQLEAGLRALARDHDFMVDVRGRGLLWGFELVSDGATKQPPSVRGSAALLAKQCADGGLLIYPCGIAPLDNAALISPPLTIAQDEVATLLARLRKAVERMAGVLSPD